MSKLLAICIPTFNRASYLDLCLSQICKQLIGFEDEIEIIISDNCSNDNTEQVIFKYATKYKLIKYFKQVENIGADRNIVTVVEKSSADYFWVFGDDDILLDDKLKIIISFLRTKVYNIVYLNNYWFSNNFLEKPKNKSDKIETLIYLDGIAFLKKINIYATFLTSSIIKSSVLLKINLNSYLGSNLCQLNWVLPSIFKAGKKLYLNSFFLACKVGNTGGYSLFKTFSINLNEIMDNLYLQKLIPLKTKAILNNAFIINFMPIYYLQFKRNKHTKFIKEIAPFKMARKIYKPYFSYWFILYPVEILWYPIAKKYYFGLKKLKVI